MNKLDDIMGGNVLGTKMETVVYKVADGCAIKADIYSGNNEGAPLIVYIHGGALIWGTRKNINPRRVELYREAGFSVISIDYRLAPETLLNQIAEDVQDAIKWIHSESKSKYGLNSDKLAVVGSSAGGYLALLTGTFPNKPKAIVSFYGYGDIIADWYCKPSEFYCMQPKVSREEAYTYVGDTIISEGGWDRFKYYLYCRQNGIWTSEVSGYDIVADKDKIMKFCPYYCAGKDFPPTLFLHGDADTDVPYTESVKMVQKLTELGVNNKLIMLKGKGHAFDRDMDDADVKNAFTEVIKFLNENIG